MLNCNNLSQARSQHLHGMEGGGGGGWVVHGRFRHLILSAAGARIFPQEILKRWVTHFMQFGNSLLGNKAGKS